jgi:hypothetical protein
MRLLTEKCFAGWPAESQPLDLRKVSSAETDRLRIASYDFTSQSGITLPLFLINLAESSKPARVTLKILEEGDWRQWKPVLASVLPTNPDQDRISAAPSSERAVRAVDILQDLSANEQVLALFPARGIGPSAWVQDPKKNVQVRRRFMLLGQTLDGMRVWDLRRAIQAIGQMNDLKEIPVFIEAKRHLAVDALYASLYESKVAQLNLSQLPNSHEDGPDYLNVLRFLDIPQAVAMAAEHSIVRLDQNDQLGWDFPLRVAAQLGWDANRFTVKTALSE